MFADAEHILEELKNEMIKKHEETKKKELEEEKRLKYVAFMSVSQKTINVVIKCLEPILIREILYTILLRYLCDNVKICGHKCGLDFILRCCECTDYRFNDNDSNKKIKNKEYKDGIGEVYVSRSCHYNYCPICTSRFK